MVVLSARDIGAQIPSGDGLAAASERGTAAAGPLTLWLDAHGTAFDTAKLERSLRRELGREVEVSEAAGSSAVEIRIDGAQRAQVRYTTPSGEELSRSVDLPPDRERALQVVTWLVVNLVRDEASELLQELRARHRQAADAGASEAQATAGQAGAEPAIAEPVAADKAALAPPAADKAAGSAAAEAARNRAARAKAAENVAGGPKPKGHHDGLLRDPLHSADLALFTPLSLVRDSARRELHVQLALLYGDSGAIRGAALAPGVLRVRRDLFGVAVGGGVVVVGGSSRGVLAAVAGAFAGDTTGFVAGAGVVNARSLNGVAASAGVTLVRGPSQGVLLAGGLNLTADHRGVEIAGGVNSTRDLQGVAVAAVNVHRRVRGLQLGVVNVAEQVDGAAIGVLSFAKNGRVQPVLWGASDGSLHLALKSSVGYVFTQFGAGIDLNAATFSYDGGIGAHLRLRPDLFFEPGVHYSALHDTVDASGAPDEQQLHYLAQLGLRVGDKLDLLVAAGVRHTIEGGTGAPVAPELRAGIAFF